MTNINMADTIEIISHDGNVILEVGHVRLRVSSNVLEAASQYFTALFGPHFREGRTLIERSTVTVPIIGDNFQAMSDMCNLLHGRNVPGLLGSNVSTERIFELAIVIDKYQCVDILALQSQGFLFPSLFDGGHSDLALLGLTVASFLLKKPKLFTMATNQFLRSCGHPVQHILTERLANALPTNVILALATKQQMVNCKLVRDLSDLLGVINLSAGDYSEMSNVGFWPPTGEWLDKLVSAGVEASEIEEFVEEVDGVCAGLCLNCAKADVWDLSTPCKVAEHQ